MENQTTRDFVLFYFPMKVGRGHIHNSWGKFLAPGSWRQPWYTEDRRLCSTQASGHVLCFSPLSYVSILLYCVCALKTLEGDFKLRRFLWKPMLGLKKVIFCSLQYQIGDCNSPIQLPSAVLRVSFLENHLCRQKPAREEAHKAYSYTVKTVGVQMRKYH